MSGNDELKESIVEAVGSLDTPRFHELAEELEVPNEELDTAIEELQIEERIRFSGRQMGYLIVDADN